MYYIFVNDGIINGFGEAMSLNEDTLNIEVSKEIYDYIAISPDKYIYSDNQIIENPDYENILQQKAITAEIESLKAQLDDLDSKRIRAVCEDEVKDSETGETWLDYYNNQILLLREQLNTLETQLAG